jgi:hypothetical protein
MVTYSMTTLGIVTFSIMKLGMVTFSILTLGIMALSITTLTITTISTRIKNTALSITNAYAESRNVDRLCSVPLS